jgi:dimethylargininase
VSAGWDLVVAPPADDCPDAVFVEDAVVMFRNVAVITRPGADERKPEVVEVEKVVEDLGCSINRIHAPGTLDGGDVLKVGDTVYVGQGGRTSPEGIAQLRSILEPLGANVVTVPVRKVLHLKSAVTALPDGTVIGYPPLVDDPAVFDRFRPVPEESGAHVVLLGDRRLLMAADAPRSAELFVELGYEPVTVDIGEFQKLEGCVTCLSVRLRHLG